MDGLFGPDTENGPLYTSTKLNLRYRVWGKQKRTVLLLCQAKGEHSREQKIHTYYEQKANEGKHVSIENQVTSLGK